jgi:glucokinase
MRAGLDIGGTKAVAVVAGRDGEGLREVRIESWTRGTWEQDFETLARTLDGLLAESGVAPEDLETLGVSAAGPLEPVRGIVLNPPNLPGWENAPVGPYFEKRLKVRVRVENDANAAALAEWRFGAGRGSCNLAFLTMSTGVGAGLILDGRLYRGARFQAGEIGHVPVVPEGRPCACGLRGCLETYTGGAALAARLRSDVAEGRSPAILELAGGDSGAVTTETWVEAIRAGDPYAVALRDEYVDHLSRGLAILVTTLDLERVILGTIVQRNPDLLLEPLQVRVGERVWKSHHDVQVLAGELGERMPAYAALSVAELEPLSP